MLKDTPTVQIFVMSADRPGYLSKALASVQESAEGEAEVLVSDNSVREDVGSLMREKFPDVRYIRRQPHLTILEHYRRILSEATGDFIVLFHDDDVMLPGYVRSMREMLEKHEVAAVGCNAIVLRGDNVAGRLFMSTTNVTFVDEVQALLRPYLSIGGDGYPPFPGYMYRRECLEGLFLEDSHAGKHADVTFLSALVLRAPILWVPEPLMMYRFHSTNISRHETLGDRLRWLRHLIARDKIDRRSSMLGDYRFKYWSRFWLERPGRGESMLPRNRREWIVCKFLLQSVVRITVTRPHVWLDVLRRRY